MWHTRVALSETQRDRILEMAREQERSTASVIRALLDEALGIESTPHRDQLQLSLGVPEWLDELRRRHAV